jgi:hypothetical protein
MDDEGQRPPGTIGALWAAPGKKIGAEPKQLDLWPAAQPTNDASKAAVDREEQRAACIDESAPGRASAESAKLKFLPMIVPPAASSCDYEIRAPRRDAFEMSAAFAGVPWLHPALVTGALAVALGVGWIAGASSSHFFAPAPAATPIRQASAPSCAREPSQEIACTTKSDRQAMAGAAAKAAAPGASAVNRWHERSRSPHLAGTAANKDPATTNSIASAAATQERAKILPRPVAVPETRPTTIEGWTIREVVGGTVVLDGPSGAWRAAQGDTVPGIGRIDSIVRWGSRWIVATSKGLISTQD